MSGLKAWFRRASETARRDATVQDVGPLDNQGCLARKYKRCTDFAHCPYCSRLEQSLRVIAGALDTT